MPADPPTSLLITPDRRRRLQQQYEEARRLLAHRQPLHREANHERIHDLLGDCLRTDPGNVLYLEALLANLRRWQPGRAGWWGRWTTPHRQTVMPPVLEEGKQSPEGWAAARTVLSQAPEILRGGWEQPLTLRVLAAACGACDLEEAEVHYLQAAAELAPGDAETLRLLAQALEFQGRLYEALLIWRQLQTLGPSEAAEQAIADLQLADDSDEEAPKGDAPLPATAEDAIAKARALIGAGRWTAAETCLATAHSLFGANLAVRMAIEDLQLARSQQRLEIAQVRAARASADWRMQSAAARLEGEHRRLELEILNARCERMPEDAALRLAVGRKLKQLGNYSGALERLGEIAARRLPASTSISAAVKVEQGECWQHLRQFGRALAEFERAAAVADHGSPEHLLAMYRAGTLAAAMGRTEDARAWLATVVESEPDFRDTRERLDKLRAT